VEQKAPQTANVCFAIARANQLEKWPKRSWPFALVVKKIKTFKTKPRIQKLWGRISRSATRGTTSSYRQQQQSQLYQQLAEHGEDYAKTMANSAIRKPSDHPTTNVQIFDDDGDKELTATTTAESYTIYCLQK
jgi:hypothetical protein